MRAQHRFSLGCAALAAFVASAEARAQTSDATLAVRVAVGATSQGLFNNGGLGATRVTVFARSGASSRYNGPTGVEGPTTGTAGAGATFTVTVPSLYSPTATGAANPYTLELTWNDTAVRTVTAGPVTLARGTANTAGPVTVDNQAPPGATSIACYANAPRGTTELYVYWSFPSARPVDFDRYELHRGSAAGFTPSAATLVAPLAYGQSNRVDTGRSPGTAYYYCIRILDQYGAFTDRCTTAPCRTDAADAGVDAGPDVADVPLDLPRDTAADAAPDAAMDVAADRADAALDAVLDVAADRADAATDASADRADAAVDRVDVVIDLGGLAGFTSVAPTSAPANTPYAYTPTAVSASGAPAASYRATDLPPGATIDPRTGAVAWIPPFGEAGMARTFTIIATLPGGGEVRQTVTVTVTCPDNDRDGRNDVRCDRGASGGDCDDARGDTFPDAPERCNGVDDDCDGLIDEGDAATLCGPGQTCDPSARTCRPACANASECTAAPRACTRDGACALCTPGPSGDATACAGSDDGRACLADSLGGVFCGCATDADCGGAASGRVCEADRHRCVPGCATGAGRNGCPAGQRCVVAGAGASARGTCTLDCTAAATCGALPALPLCPDTGTRRCVECLSDANCSGNADGRVYCDAASGNCVACLQGGVSQCTAAGAGAACLPGGACGCNTDADCGANDSGRVCDAFTHACRAGCRPPGAVGNACPNGATCTPAGTTVGRCAAPTGDAGADAAADASGDADPGDAANDLGAPDANGPDVANDAPVADAAPAPPDAPDDLGLDGSVRRGSFQGGCGCRVGAPRAADARLVGLAALAALVARRRRRRG
ncbi:MAG: MopE-related protein [Polyangiales bacterium]